MSSLLVELRGDRLQSDVAELAGLTQAKVSRAENGRFPFSPEQAEAYAQALDATSEQRKRLVSLAEAFAEQNITTRSALVRSARAIQERIGRLETESRLIRSWLPDLIPGVVQTEAYTAAVVGFDPGPAWLAARAARRARLVEPGRTWHLLVSEAALRWPMGSHELMADQLDRLIQVSTMPNVELGILDFSTPKAVAPPAAFHLYGRRAASVAVETGTYFPTEPRDLDHLDRLFADLDAVAVHEGAARALLENLAADHRDRAAG